MRDVTTIELKRDTHRKLLAMGDKSESFDEIINRLMIMKQHVDEYIQKYIEEKDGECILTTLFGRTIIANHNFETVCGTAKCTKCGLPAPVIIKKDNFLADISVGYGDHNDINVDNYSSFDDAIVAAKKKIPYGGIIKLDAGVYTICGEK